MELEQKLLAYFQEHEQEIFSDLEKLVACEADTADIEGLKKVREVLKTIIKERVGADAVELGGENGHSVVHFEQGAGEQFVALIGHYDTVHPAGSFRCRREGDRWYAPGVYDMKSGLVSAIWNAKAFKDLGIDPGKKLVFLFNGDEETGSGESKEPIREHVLGGRAALICEPCINNGDLKSGRKGGLNFTVTIHGKAAHAGNAHQLGVNAIEEMAREIQFIHTLTDYDKGTTLNVGVCSGGSKVNIVPDTAVFQVDCRVKTFEEMDRVNDAILNYVCTVPGSTREVVSRAPKPPFMETEDNMALVRLAQACGEKLDMHFGYQFVGGCSDGNFTSSYGVPTLDSMGTIGDGAHTPDEFIYVDQYIRRIALLGSVLCGI